MGRTGEQSYISHVGLVDVSITVTDASGSHGIGGLVGVNQGTIINSHVTGVSLTASASYTTGSTVYIGGLVGNNYYPGVIINSYATAVSLNTNTDSGNSSIGGLAGTNYSGGIYNSYAAGTVSSSSPKPLAVGGLIGESNGGLIHNSYATGTVSSTNSGSSYISQVGGLIGLHNGSTTLNSYATGTVKITSSCTLNNCTAYNGGLVGRIVFDGVINGTNYFVHNSGGDNGIGSGSCSEDSTCARKTLVELQGLTSTNVTDWSTDNWDFGTTTQLPRLKYAEIAAYCINSTYTTKETCEAASSSWVAEGDECNGETGVVCGDIIPGQ